jgi:alpha-tubulin suppressor-like RCC1 family protein
MKRSSSILIVLIVTALLSGCILSKTPSTNEVAMTFGEQMTFSVKVFPTNATYAWTLDGAPLSNPGKSYTYNALAGEHTLMVRATQAFGTDTQTWHILSNSHPVAHTGPDQTVDEKTLVTLDASNSTDPDGDIVSYAWEQTGGTQIVLSNPSGITTTFQAPEVGQGGEALTFKLTVTDGTGLTSTATCIVNVTWINEPPTAITGPDQTVAEGISVILDGSNSTDPDDGIAAYEWKQLSGPSVVLMNANTMQATFTTPDVSPSGAALTFELTVTDNGGLKSSAQCIVNVTWINDPPTAITGPDQTVSEGIIVSIDASNSYDTDDGIASYDWQQTEGLAVTLSDAAAIQPTFTAPNVTPAGAVLKFKLTVTDNGGLKSTATCIVNVTWINEPPTAEAGPDQSISVGTLVTLNGENSTDPDDGIASYLWQQTGGPSVTLTNPDASITQFIASVAAGSTLTFELTVTDAGRLTFTDSCIIEVHQSIITGSKIATGAHHSLAIKSDGSLWAWGYNAYGQLGDGTTIDKHVPTHIGILTDWVVVAAGGGGSHSVAIKTDGSLWTWGGNTAGELGDGTMANKSVPMRIGTDTDWISVAAGGSRTFAIKRDRSLWACGWNGFGELGDGTTMYKIVLTHIGTDTDWAFVSAGENHTVALKTDGSLWAWGNNAAGQLGDGTTTDKHVPTRIGNDTDWISVVAGAGNTVAMKDDRSLWAWGYNEYGQLGDGTNINRIMPTRIGSETTWDLVSAGWEHILTIKDNGSLWAWGLNYIGQLGDGTYTDRNVPTQIGTDNDWAVVTVAYYQTVAIKQDGSLWAWGGNYYGELGDGTTTEKNVPTRIGTDTDW